MGTHQGFDIGAYVTSSLQAELDAAQQILVQSNVCKGTVEERSSRVNATVVEDINQFPQGNVKWFVHTEMGTEYWRASCFSVLSQNCSDQEDAAEGSMQREKARNCLGRALSVECQLLPSDNKAKDTMYDLILGSIIKACTREDKSQSAERPAMVLFETEGVRLQLQHTLKAMGITTTGVAGQDLTSSAASFHDVAYTTKKRALNLLLNMDPANPQPLRDLVESALKLEADKGYVSEVRVSLRKWKPPRDCKIPLDWFATPPQRQSHQYNDDIEDLLGWRTNFQRAFQTCDIDKMKEIATKRPHKDVKMFCECLLLLNKACERGLVDVIRLLLGHCGCHVEGVQNTNTPKSWRNLQAALGDTEDAYTPLHIAAYWGRTEVVRLLLERGASMTAQDCKHGMSPLLVAASQGHSDIVEILCKAGADITAINHAGEDAVALADSARQQKRTASEARPFRRAVEILQSYDSRCGFCHSPGSQFRCPCGVESYCSKECQRAQWQAHKKKHRTMLIKLKKAERVS